MARRARVRGEKKREGEEGGEWGSLVGVRAVEAGTFGKGKQRSLACLDNRWDTKTAEAAEPCCEHNRLVRLGSDVDGQSHRKYEEKGREKGDRAPRVPHTAASPDDAGGGRGIATVDGMRGSESKKGEAKPPCRPHTLPAVKSLRAGVPFGTTRQCPGAARRKLAIEPAIYKFNMKIMTSKEKIKM